MITDEYLKYNNNDNIAVYNSGTDPNMLNAFYFQFP